MRKYRIVEKYHSYYGYVRFYPQWKFMFWWQSFEDGYEFPLSYTFIEEAKQYIDNEKERNRLKKFVKYHEVD